MTEHEMSCEIFQHGDLYNCGVYIDVGEGEPLTFGVIRADKIKINYNSNRGLFGVIFFNGSFRIAECYVKRVCVNDLEKMNKIQLPSYEAEWPYDDLEIYYKEE